MKMKKHIIQVLIVGAIVSVCIHIHIFFTSSSNKKINSQTSNLEISKKVQENIIKNPDYSLSDNGEVSLSDVKEFIGIQKSYKENEGEFSVAIIDSGIFPAESFTKNRNKIIYFKDFLYNKKNPYDDSGHGTAIAGIIAADKTSKADNSEGIAPYIDLISLKVLNYQNGGNVNTIIEALQWVIENKDRYNIRVINLSIGIDTYDKRKQKIETICEKAYKSGIIIVTSSGNIEYDLIEYTPANLKDVISVGSLELQDNKIAISDYSQSWVAKSKKVPDIYALGTNIITTKSNTLYKGNNNEKITYENEYEAVSGTSFSTAIVTGYICYLIHMDPDISNSEIISRLYHQNTKIWDENIEKNVPVLKGE